MPKTDFHSFQEFLDTFVPQVARKAKQLNQAVWVLETTGSKDAADLKAELDTELRWMLQDPRLYRRLLEWDPELSKVDPMVKRQMNVLLRAFKENQIAKDLLEEIAQKEAALAMTYATFRSKLDGKTVSENEIREILTKESDPKKRMAAWEASKEIGVVLAPQILDLVHLRNKAATSLGYSDYFQMQLALQEVDPVALLKLLDDFAKRSEAAYAALAQDMEAKMAKRFQVPISSLGPWSWAEPFGQEDPIDAEDLDALVEGVDIAHAGAEFYRRMGIDVSPILARSDMEERPGKNQHAFCIHIDRMGDIRTLNNIKPSLKWLETVLHELGHAVYEVGLDPSLPWLLKAPPHMITTEAMALIAGRQAYRYGALEELVGTASSKEALRKRAEESLRRRQLIFSRWVLVMTAFESELYKNPNQDLNALWWSLVEKHQKIKMPKNRQGKSDWAAKYHIGLAPVYYYSYLLGELFASAIEEKLVEKTGSSLLSTKKAGDFLQSKLFSPGNRMPWNELIVHLTGAPLSPDAWLREFAR